MCESFVSAAVFSLPVFLPPPVNYPYPANFLAPLPAWPMNVSLTFPTLLAWVVTDYSVPGAQTLFCYYGKERGVVALPNSLVLLLFALSLALVFVEWLSLLVIQATCAHLSQQVYTNDRQVRNLKNLVFTVKKFSTCLEILRRERMRERERERECVWVCVPIFLQCCWQFMSRECSSCWTHLSLERRVT